MASQQDRKGKLTILWVFASLNFLYTDVVALFDMFGSGKPLHLTPGALLGVSVLVEVPMAMVVLSYVLSYRPNRWANVAVGIAYTAVTLLTQFLAPLVLGTATSYYLFFGVVELLTTGYIVWYAWTWPAPAANSGAAAPDSG